MIVEQLFQLVGCLQSDRYEVNSQEGEEFTHKNARNADNHKHQLLFSIRWGLRGYVTQLQ